MPKTTHSGAVNGVLFRPMTVGDVDQVAAIEATVSPEPWSQSLLEGELDLPDEGNHWRVAVDESTAMVIGFGGVMVVADEAHIMNIAVCPNERRRGIARQLLAQLLAAAHERGAVAVTLEVRSGNKAALALYAGFGFKRAGRRPGYYRDGADAVIMWRHDRSGGRS